MTIRTTKAERAVKAEKRRINRELRELRKDHKSLITGRYINDRGWWGVPYCPRRCGVEPCEGCITREVLREQAEPLAQQIEELKRELQRLTGELEPAPLRQATVFTGRGEQLVMFV